MTQVDFFASLVNGQPLEPEGSRLAIAEWTALGTALGDTPQLIAPLHIHHNDDEAWYVLEGTLGFKVGDMIVEANANQAVVVPRGTPHTYWNPKPATARYIIIMTSQIRSLIDEIHATEQRNIETLKEIFRKYESELLE
ncbi:cupin domain-containing protein [Paenibacillus sp. KQZ6P-2]|uniref:Cupin domain-containing protein n=1 Tax=Paenibacillus mangrovi TaxID=2931978 RepID=A0A9X1WK28_9BACL|nr:cupin domain-containing protein [Paenibacillus mangrovi]MCJ8010782.1 cupin domain-containing protein [Paenibacillus mangrovi]